MILQADVFPAKAENQFQQCCIPAFAGMTNVKTIKYFSQSMFPQMRDIDMTKKEKAVIPRSASNEES